MTKTEAEQEIKILMDAKDNLEKQLDAVKKAIRDVLKSQNLAL